VAEVKQTLEAAPVRAPDAALRRSRSESVGVRALASSLRRRVSTSVKNAVGSPRRVGQAAAGPNRKLAAHGRSASESLPVRPHIALSFIAPPPAGNTDRPPALIDSPESMSSPYSLDSSARPRSKSLAAHIDSATSPIAQFASLTDLSVPQKLQFGTLMTKVTGKKQKRVVFRLDPDQGQIIWESKKHRISACCRHRPLLMCLLTCVRVCVWASVVPIENIKELRSGADARYYREQFHLSQEFESRWLTIIYVLDGQYKTLHVVAPSRDDFQMWDITLRKLYAVRQELMSGPGNIDLREAVWEKQYWTGADDGADQRLYFEDVEKLCKRLNINPSQEDLLRRFQV